MFLTGAQVRYPDGTPVFAFKLHQFISQGRAVYATYEARDRRYLTLDGQYYAPGADGARLLFPLVFCRVCGQEYYKVCYDESNSRVTPWGEAFDEEEDEQSQRGYLMMPSSEGFDWSVEDLPTEWLNVNGRVRSNYKKRLPRLIHVAPDGAASTEPGGGTVKGYFQTSPFLLCLNCGEYYTGRQREFTKLSGLSSEGRSSATTVLSIASLDNAEKAGIASSARKLLSFTDNRQDASLQAGHCNDFVRVSLLRGAIYAALRQHGELRHFNIASKTVSALGLQLRDVAQNPELDPLSPHAATVWKCFEDLIQYRIYEDLRRAWRIVHPNLEQCGLLRVDYEGLESACSREDLWRELPPLARLSGSERLEILRPILDFCRKKLAIRAECLRETYQQQLRQRVNQVINDRWNFDESEERLRQAERLILPDQPANHLTGVSLSARSLVGRYLRRRLPDISDYSRFVRKLVAVLASQGLLRVENERGVEYAQLEAAVLIWRPGDGNPPPPDPIYSRRAASPIYVQVQRRANEFFRELYSRRALSLRFVEGLAHTAQIQYSDRQERERRFRDGDLPLLFCSPTMELGIDIRDLQLVHMRNIPPTPASYAQRSGRAGRKGDPALILAYCAAGSGHDQYFFRRREEMVAGAVRPPRIDLSNEDLVRAHIHALWLSKVSLRIERSIDELLELQLDDLPLKDSVRAAIELSEVRLRECIEEGQRVLDLCEDDLGRADWFTPAWLEGTLRRAPQAFNEAFDRWRQLYRAATAQLLEAQRIQATSFDERQQREAKQRVDEAIRQRNLLTNTGTLREESDFYPYRYLASEGFLPGYNFPRLPVRVYVPREDGEFISRPRFLAITEFGPDNLIYHEGAKYQVHRFWTPPGGLGARRSTAKLCNVC
ncbi:MAG TPA: helicase-related protein, partial [Bryobacteraceae bacterium]|nr:helicase-related protein [Bryobacteraceae bacterium]